MSSPPPWLLLASLLCSSLHSSEVPTSFLSGHRGRHFKHPHAVCRKVCFNAFHSLSTTTTAPSLLDVLLQRCSHKYSSLTIKMTLLIIFSASLAHLPPEAPLESCHKHFIVTLHILHSTSFSHLLSFHCAFNLIPSCYKVLSLGTQVEPSNQG